MRQEAKASLSADLTFPRSIENFATLLLEFSSLWRARERIAAEYRTGNLLERQLGVFEAVVIERNPRSRLGIGQSHLLRLLFHSRGSVSLAESMLSGERRSFRNERTAPRQGEAVSREGNLPGGGLTVEISPFSFPNCSAVLRGTYATVEAPDCAVVIPKARY